MGAQEVGSGGGSSRLHGGLVFLQDQPPYSMPPHAHKLWSPIHPNYYSKCVSVFCDWGCNSFTKQSHLCSAMSEEEQPIELSLVKHKNKKNKKIERMSKKTLLHSVTLSSDMCIDWDKNCSITVFHNFLFSHCNWMVILYARKPRVVAHPINPTNEGRVGNNVYVWQISVDVELYIQSVTWCFQEQKRM